MSRQGSLFDPGIILLWAEKGLTSISLAMEDKTEKLLKKCHVKDRRKQHIAKKEKQRKKDHQQLAKEQDSKLEYVASIETRMDKEKIQERMESIERFLPIVIDGKKHLSKKGIGIERDICFKEKHLNEITNKQRPYELEQNDNSKDNPQELER